MEIDDIAWQPLKPGGASFQMYQMEEQGGCIRLRRSAAYVRFVLFFASFLLIPLILSIGFLVDGQVVPGLVIGTIALLLLGGFALWYNRGKYLKGGFDFTSGRWEIGHLSGALGEIRAIQVIGELVPKSEYRWAHSYEVNLIFDGARRINVIDHGHKPSANELAETLARRLQVPLWSRDLL